MKYTIWLLLAIFFLPRPSFALVFGDLLRPDISEEEFQQGLKDLAKTKPYVFFAHSRTLSVGDRIYSMDKRLDPGKKGIVKWSIKLNWSHHYNLPRNAICVGNKKSGFVILPLISIFKSEERYINTIIVTSRVPPSFAKYCQKKKIKNIHFANGLRLGMTLKQAYKLGLDPRSAGEGNIGMEYSSEYWKKVYGFDRRIRFAKGITCERYKLPGGEGGFSGTSGDTIDLGLKDNKIVFIMAHKFGFEDYPDFETCLKVAISYPPEFPERIQK